MNATPLLLLPPEARSEAFYEDLLEPTPPSREPARPASRTLLTALLVLLLVGLLALPALPVAAATAAEVTADLRMADDAAPMRRAAERFVEHARRGDAAGSAAMLSRALVDRIGPAGAERAMREQVLPFFARGGEIGRSVTVTRTTDAAGQQGFAFYMWLARADGEPRPFTVYVVEERGAPVIANVVPDRRVEGRHR